MLKVLLSLSLLTSSAIATDNAISADNAIPAEVNPVRVTEYQKTIELMAAENYSEETSKHLITMKEIDKLDNINLQYEAAAKKIGHHIDALDVIIPIITNMKLLSISTNNGTLSAEDKILINQEYQSKTNSIKDLLTTTSPDNSIVSSYPSREYNIYSDVANSLAIDTIKLNSLDFVWTALHGTSLLPDPLGCQNILDNLLTSIRCEYQNLENLRDKIGITLQLNQKKFLTLQEETKRSLALQVMYLNNLQKNFLS